MKLSDIVLELGKVQTAKDNPPFKTPQQIEKEAIANPINKKYDFKKPTMISMSSQDMKTLHQDGTVEINGITIVYEK